MTMPMLRAVTSTWASSTTRSQCCTRTLHTRPCPSPGSKTLACVPAAWPVRSTKSSMGGRVLLVVVVVVVVVVYAICFST